MSNRLDFLDIPTTENFVTIRLGQKWQILTERDLVVDIYQTGGTQLVASGRVMSVGFCPIKNIPGHSLMLEHDPSCRTVMGVVDAMQECYKDKTINEYSMVTVLTISAPALKEFVKAPEVSEPAIKSRDYEAEAEVGILPSPVEAPKASLGKKGRKK